MRCNDVSVKRGRFFSDPGSPVKDVFAPDMLPDGQIVLVKTGVQNTDEVIQASYESTTLECILSRFANGDLSALNRYQPIYADVADAPKNLAEALRLFTRAEEAFSVLPKEIKQQFGNDYRKWILSSADPEWFEKMKPVYSPVQPAAPSSDPIKTESVVAPAE